MILPLSSIIELTLTALLAVTLIYCIVLERRLRALRSGQDGLKATIGALNAAIVTAGAAMKGLKGASAEAAELLDGRLSRARALADELELITASGARIAERMDRSTTTKAAMPSGTVMGRLDALRAVR